MKIFSDVRVAHHLGIGLLVAAAMLGFATSAQARVLLGSPGPAALSNGLVGYWPLDGAVTNWTSNTTRDLSGNGNTARFYLSSTSTSPVTGKIGQAIHPIGNITVPHSTSINLGSTLSVSFWLKGTAKAPWDGLIGKTDFATGWLIQNADSNGSRDLYVRMDTSAAGNQNCTAPVGITNVLDGTWHHVVLVVTNGTCTLYKDSVRGTPGTFSVGTGFANPAADLTFEGGDADATDSTYDDVRLYNRALTQAEISQLYNLGTANAGHANTVALSNGLVGYWPLDGSAINWNTNTFNDISGNGNNATSTVMSTTSSPVAGKIGQALQFNGTSQYITRDGNLNSLSFGAPLTLSAWIKMPALVKGAIVLAGNSVTHHRTRRGWIRR